MHFVILFMINSFVFRWKELIFSRLLRNKLLNDWKTKNYLCCLKRLVYNNKKVYQSKHLASSLSLSQHFMFLFLGSSSRKYTNSIEWEKGHYFILTEFSMWKCHSPEIFDMLVTCFFQVPINANVLILYLCDCVGGLVAGFRLKGGLSIQRGKS